MADLTPAEELCAAAARLREVAKDATPGPWSVGNGEVIGLDIEQTSRGSFTYGAQLARVLDDATRDEENYGGHDLGSTEADAAWLALAHPGLAEPLAVLLEEAAEFVAQLAEHYPRLPVQPHARTLAIARVINGSGS